ncbi:hypothetical protein [Photobacterium iliopiscarium]|jgi:hypothetical protein|uniref:hypothetical protein n=1 Tax=Photobacterium iliopiscarium TaxID=56192 RepID=UPI000A4DF911|nr:hypothetical protein [Photobacterium iliopiscarium]
MGYPLVAIVNSSNFVAHGSVRYAACSSDQFLIAPHTTWTAKTRGLCLLTKIEGHMTLAGNKEVKIKEYKSSGTSYSQYVIIQTAPETFEVTRRVCSSKNNDISENYVENIDESVN